MCLHLKNKFVLPKFTFRDKIVYKFLIEDEFGLRTPFQDYPVKIGEVVSSKIEKYRDEINKGIHSFKELEYCLKESAGHFGKIVIVECIIPRFTWYYKGTFGKGVSYASNKLKYNIII